MSRKKLGLIHHIECFDAQGRLKWVEEIHNQIPDAALDHILDVYFHGTAPIGTWFLTIFEDNYAPDGSETYAAPGYTECTAYDEAERQEWVEAAASGQSTSNSGNKAVLTMNATKTIYGSALVGGGTAASTKGDTAGGGTLVSIAPWTTPRSVIAADTLNITHTATFADDGV